MKFEIEFSGHENIRSNHKKTIEITKESHLTLRGDCIVGVNAKSSCADIPEELKNKLRNPDSKVTFSIKVGDEDFVLESFEIDYAYEGECSQIGIETIETKKGIITIDNDYITPESSELLSDELFFSTCNSSLSLSTSCSWRSRNFL